MPQPLLVIGNKNYSSWSLRPWLVLKHAGIEFQERRLPLNTPQFDAEIPRYSPSGRVPALHDGGTVIWESLAICEYLADRYPDAGLWPRDITRRAQARAVACEMHAGFTDLRAALPMNCRARGRRVTITPAVQADIRRVQQIWRDCLAGSGGPWLFRAFSIADAMYAPVVLRFVNYQVKLDDDTRAYMNTWLEDAALQEWITAGQAETEVVAADEAGED